MNTLTTEILYGQYNIIPQMSQKISVQFVCPSPKFEIFEKKTLSGYPWSMPEQIKPELELVAKMRTRIKRKLIIHIEGAVEGLLDKIKTFERSRVRQEKPDT